MKTIIEYETLNTSSWDSSCCMAQPALCRAAEPVRRHASWIIPDLGYSKPTTFDVFLQYWCDCEGDGVYEVHETKWPLLETPDTRLWKIPSHQAQGLLSVPLWPSADWMMFSCIEGSHYFPQSADSNAYLIEQHPHAYLEITFYPIHGHHKAGSGWPVGFLITMDNDCLHFYCSFSSAILCRWSKINILVLNLWLLPN